MEQTGTLYLCATPIGNLKDITQRAVEMLRAADCIAAEDTRHTRRLLAHYDIHTPMTSYHEHNKAEKGAALITRLKAGEHIVCVSDAGLPGIADPGSDLARRAIEAGIPVTPLPGANAALSARICAGLPCEGFTFVGFLPRKEKKQKELLARIRQYPETLIFYEAPHRLVKTLTAMAAAFGGERRISLARELTKKYEEVRHFSLAEAVAYYQLTPPKGEYVLIVAGKDRRELQAREQQQWTEMSLEEHLDFYVRQGIEPKQALKQMAKDRGTAKRELYRYFHGQSEGTETGGI